MKPLQFLLDRLPLILSFTAALLFILLVVHLSTGPLSLNDVLYALLLGAASTVAIIGTDWLRHRRFRRALDRLVAGETDTVLPRGANREQRAVRSAINRLRTDYLNRLKEHETAADNHRMFIDQWVHQMKTPLAVIDLSVQSEEDPDKLRSTISSETALLHDGLELVLATARLEHFAADLKAARIDLAGLVRESVNELRASWIRHGIYPRIAGPEEPLMVSSDPKWLKLVLRQLLTNAIKYSHEGQEVLISLAGDASLATLKVIDSGIGIPSEDLPRVFDRFFTGANGRLRPAATGMGLHLAAQVCQRLGHGLSVRSVVGQGSEFIISFQTRSITEL